MARTGRAIDAGELASDLVRVLSRALAGRLTSVLAHGSWVHGNFDPGRSDVDLLAVLAEDPTGKDVERLSAQLEALFACRPEWVDRVEVGLVTSEAVRDVVATGRSARAVGGSAPASRCTWSPRSVAGCWTGRRRPAARSSTGRPTRSRRCPGRWCGRCCSRS